MAPDDALEAIPVLERVGELAVIIGLIVLGVRIGRPIRAAQDDRVTAQPQLPPGRSAKLRGE